MRSCSDASSSLGQHRRRGAGRGSARRRAPRSRRAPCSPVSATPASSVARDRVPALEVGQQARVGVEDAPGKRAMERRRQDGAEAGHRDEVDARSQSAPRRARRCRRSRSKVAAEPAEVARGRRDAPRRRRRARPRGRDRAGPHATRATSSPACSMASRIVPDARDQDAETDLGQALQRLDDARPSSRRPRSGSGRRARRPSASASIFAWAVPFEPEMMAPAWPILRPGGAVTPAM